MTGKLLCDQGDTAVMPELYDEFAVLSLPDKKIAGWPSTFRTIEEAEEWRAELYRRKEEMRLAAEEWDRKHDAGEHMDTNAPVYHWERQWKGREFEVVRRQITPWDRTEDQSA